MRVTISTSDKFPWVGTHTVDIILYGPPWTYDKKEVKWVGGGLFTQHDKATHEVLNVKFDFRHGAWGLNEWMVWTNEGKEVFDWKDIGSVSSFLDREETEYWCPIPRYRFMMCVIVAGERGQVGWVDFCDFDFLWQQTGVSSYLLAQLVQLQ